MKDLKGKKVLILAGAMVHLKLVEAAKELGCHTIVTDYLESSPAKEIADDKLGVALDRLKQNADLKLFELENKIRGIL